MITLIDTKEELEKRLPELIEAHRSMFSEPPFNNPSITYETSRDFFLNTYENGLIFIDTKSDGKDIYGFRTMIRAEKFRDFDKFDIDRDSMYLSCLWIKKGIRGRNLGNELMSHSLSFVKKHLKINKFYVRTRTDTPEIRGLLVKKGFEPFEDYETEFNGVKVGLTMWRKYA